MRRRRGAVGSGSWAMLAGLALVAGAGCSGGSDSSAAADRPETTATTAPATEPPVPAGQTFSVGRHDLSLVDTSRPTDGQSLDERTLPLIVLYPAAGAPGMPTQMDAPIAEGSFPLVVFSHGLNASGQIYAQFVEPLARQGYVVALPTFPLSKTPTSQQADYVNQPADVSFVIDEVFRVSEGGDESADAWLAGHLDREHVAAAGHSLGAVTTLGLAFNDCCLDDRVDAVVSVSGIALDYPDGEYTWPDRPLLLVHGGKDAIVPVTGSDTAFDAATGPTWYLRYPEGDHFGVGVGPDGTLTMQAATAFLDAVLKDSSTALDALPAAIAASGRAEWRTKP